MWVSHGGDNDDVLVLSSRYIQTFRLQKLSLSSGRKTNFSFEDVDSMFLRNNGYLPTSLDSVKPDNNNIVTHRYLSLNSIYYSFLNYLLIFVRTHACLIRKLHKRKLNDNLYAYTYKNYNTPTPLYKNTQSAVPGDTKLRYSSHHVKKHWRTVSRMTRIHGNIFQIKLLLT